MKSGGKGVDFMAGLFSCRWSRRRGPQDIGHDCVGVFVWTTQRQTIRGRRGSGRKGLRMMEWDMCVAEMGRRQESNRGQGPREMEFEVDGGKLLAELDFPIAFATRQLEKKNLGKATFLGVKVVTPELSHRSR